mmetsp:Transcript_112450/g.195072  ORF Transcript_112450/g.195072 Transcript_112450/m.195072 type:complete len:261 (+) Transcript_112450:622-1404(+)
MIKIGAAQVIVAGNAKDIHRLAVHVQQRSVESATANVINKHVPHSRCFVQIVSHSSRCRFFQHTHDLNACPLESLLRSCRLFTGKLGWHTDHCLLHVVTHEGSGRLLQMSHHLCTYINWGHLAVTTSAWNGKERLCLSGICHCVVAGIWHDTERVIFTIVFHLLHRSPDKSLGVENGLIRVHTAHGNGWLSYNDHIIGIRHHRWHQRPVREAIRHDNNFATRPYCNDGESGAEVNANCLLAPSVAHGCHHCSSYDHDSAD